MTGQSLRRPYGITWSTGEGSYAQTGYVYRTIFDALLAAQLGHTGQDPAIQVDPMGSAYPDTGEIVYAAVETRYDVVARSDVEDPPADIALAEWLGRWTATDHGTDLMGAELRGDSLNASLNGGENVGELSEVDQSREIPTDRWSIQATISMHVANGEVLRVIVEPHNGVEFDLEVAEYTNAYLSQDAINDALGVYLDRVRQQIPRDKYPFVYPLEWEG